MIKIYAQPLKQPRYLSEQVLQLRTSHAEMLQLDYDFGNNFEAKMPIMGEKSCD